MIKARGRSCRTKSTKWGGRVDGHALILNSIHEFEGGRVNAPMSLLVQIAAWYKISRFSQSSSPSSIERALSKSMGIAAGARWSTKPLEAYREDWRVGRSRK